MKTKHPSYCCQKCGELIGWIGRVLPFHKCKEKNMNSLPRYNEKAELDTRLRVDPVTGDVGIGTPQRTWVGLTDEEKAQFVVAYYPSNWDRKTAVSLMSDYEKYLKEKNHV